MFASTFWKQATERALKTAAQSVILFWGVGDGLLNAWEADWAGAGGIALGGLLLSYLTSIVSAGVGPTGSPSMVEGNGTAHR